MPAKKSDPPKKRPEPKPLLGKHHLSPDGRWITIDGHRFRRIVLPSIASPSKDQQLLEQEMDSIDPQRAPEAEELDHDD